MPSPKYGAAIDLKDPPAVVSFPTQPPSPKAPPPAQPPPPTKPATPVAAPPVVQPMPQAPAAAAVPTGTTLAPPPAAGAQAPAGTGGNSQSGQQIAAASAAEADAQARAQRDRDAATQPLFSAPPIDPNAPRMAMEVGPGKEENRYDFKAEDPSIQGPSDFVGFGRFAGLNDDVMRDIADRAATTAGTARADAAKLLDTAKAQAKSNNMPMDKTPAYEQYMQAMSKIGTGVDEANATTNNPFEDALRGVYAKANVMRDNRQEGNALNKANVDAKAFDYYETNRKETEAKAKAEADKKAADAAALKAEQERGAREAAEAMLKKQQKREGDLALINSMPEPQRTQTMNAYLLAERERGNQPAYMPGFYSQPKQRA